MSCQARTVAEAFAVDQVEAHVYRWLAQQRRAW